MLGKSRVFLFAFAALVVLASIVAVCFVLVGKRATDESLRVLMRDRFQLNYEIEKGASTDSFVDLGGEWRVKILGQTNADIAISRRLSLADEADVAFFKNRLQANSLSPSDLAGYQLYRTDMQLGTRTICEVSKCKVYVLRKSGTETVFVGIYKN